MHIHLLPQAMLTPVWVGSTLATFGFAETIVYTRGGAIFEAAIAQLGERQTEDLKVPGSIPGLGMLFSLNHPTPKPVSSFR